MTSLADKRSPPSSTNQGCGASEVKKSKGAFDVFKSDPVLMLTVNQSNAVAINPSSPTLLQDLLSPLPRDYFLRNLFRKKAVHIASKRNVKNIVENYMYNLDMRHVLEETSSDNVFVWLAPHFGGGDDDGSSNKTIRSIEVDSESALPLFECGHATYCRAPPELEQTLVSSLLRDTGLGCGQFDPSGERSTVLGRGEVEVFAASRAGHTTNWHTDFQENFTIQLSGQKRWTLKQGRASHPLRGCTPHYRAPDAVEGQLKSARLSAHEFEFTQPDETNSFGTEESVLLQPGDCFYFPAGMWHKVETVEAGVSINVSLMATNYASLFCQSLQHLLLKHDGWREAVANVDNISAADTLENLLSTLPGILANLEASGGARAVLPPVLLRPPQFTVIGEDNDDTDEGETDNNEGEEDDIEPIDEEAVDADRNSIDNNSSATISSREMRIVVDCDSFELPKGKLQGIDLASCSNKGRKLVKNPLANLMQMKDITAYYEDTKQEEKKRADDGLYVLNINYAGNEVHESIIRTVIKAGEAKTDEILLACCTSEKCGDDPAEVVQQLISGREQMAPMPCLLYYGYFVLTE